MKVIDISWPVFPGMTEYKNKGSVQFVKNKDFPKDAVRDTDIVMNAHTGTHVDAPSHFLQDGGTIES